MLGTVSKGGDQAIVDKAISEVGEIATLPEVTVKIIQIVENPKSTARDLHDVIKNDPALAARILKVVNSAFYGLPGQIASVDRAIVLLGLSAVKNIAIAASMTRLFQGSGQVEGFKPLELWQHSIAVGVGCRMLTALQGHPTVEESFLAGLIHDIGLLIERQVFPRKLAEVIARSGSEGGSFTELEKEIIGADHQAFGMALAAKWRFPRPLWMAIGYHHNPMNLATENQELAAIVHVADLLAGQAEIGFTLTVSDSEITDEILEILKITRDAIGEIREQLPEQVQTTEALFRE